MAAPTDADPLLHQAARLLEELRERCAAPDPGSEPEELLVGGYTSALALEGARRRLREQALDLTERELRLAALERELRALLRTFQGMIRGGIADAPAAMPSDDEAAPQGLH
jgi:hypothetical protein